MDLEAPGPGRGINGRVFLAGGTALLLFVALLAFLWVLRSDTQEADRNFWGTPTPTPAFKVLPF